MLAEWSIALKLLYFFVNFQYYSFYNYRPNFAESHNITKSLFGQMFGFILLLCFFTNSFIATLNDKFERSKLLICILLVLSCVSFELFYFLPDQKTYFWIIMLIYSLSSTGLPALLDKFAIEYLSKEPNLNPSTYGNQRLFGTLGYVLSNFVIESFVRPPGQPFNFETLQWIVPVVTIPAIITTLFVVKNYESSHPTRDIETGFFELIKNKEYMFFIFIIFLNGLSRAAMTLYLSIYLDKVLNLQPYSVDKSDNFLKRAFFFIFGKINDKPIATTSLAGVVFEITILFQSKRVISAFGLYWPLLFAQIAQFVRFLGYYALPYNNYHVFGYSCLLETCKGINFGLTHSSAVHIANKLCPRHLKSTSQMIYTGTFTALATFFAGQLFGSIFSKSVVGTTPSDKSQEFSLFFKTNMVLSIVCCGLFVIKYGFVDKALTIQRTEKDSLLFDEKKKDSNNGEQKQEQQIKMDSNNRRLNQEQQIQMESNQEKKIEIEDKE